MEEEVVNKKTEEGKKKKPHLAEKHSGWRHSGYRLFPSSDEVAGTYHGIHHLLYPQPLCQPATAD